MTTTANLAPTYIGQVGDTGVYRLDLAAAGLTTVRTIVIRDDNFISGGSGGASGFDLDFIRISASFTSSASTAATTTAVNAFDFTSGVSFRPGFLQTWRSSEPAFWNTPNLFGTTDSHVFSHSLATLGTRDASNNNALGEVALGEGGYIAFTLNSDVTTSGRYLYIGDAGGGNDDSFVVLSDQLSVDLGNGITLNGTPSDDLLVLGQGSNVQMFSGDDLISGGNNFHLGSGDDFINGSGGSDWLDGSSGNDVLHGGDGRDWLDGSSGNDVLHGEDGRDILEGGPGADFMAGGPGEDEYYVDNTGDIVLERIGEGSIDLVHSGISYTLPANVEHLNLWGFASNGTGNAGRNGIRGNEHANVLRGLNGDDSLGGEGGNDRLLGGQGDDDLDGDAGNDRLEGGLGYDILNGGAGNDRLVGGLLRDLLVGGPGRDVFEYSSLRDFGAISNDWERITDFRRGQRDVIDLRAIDAESGRGNQAFHFLGARGFDRTKGALIYRISDDQTFVEGDVTGDGRADFRIELDGAIRLAARDFLL